MKKMKDDDFKMLSGFADRRLNIENNGHMYVIGQNNFRFGTLWKMFNCDISYNSTDEWLRLRNL